MSKIKTANYTVNEEVLKKFNEVCDLKSINKSAWVQKKMESLIKEYEEEQKIKN